MRKLPPDQKIMDAFAEMDVADQSALLDKLLEMHRFSAKRDKRIPAKKPDQPLLQAAE